MGYERLGVVEVKHRVELYSSLQARRIELESRGSHSVDTDE